MKIVKKSKNCGRSLYLNDTDSNQRLLPILVRSSFKMYVRKFKLSKEEKKSLLLI